MSVAAAELFLTSHLRLGSAPLSRGPWTAHYTLHITHYTLHVTPFVTYWDITCSLQRRTLHHVMRYEGSIDKDKKFRTSFKGVKFILCFLETLWTRTAPAAARTNAALFSQSASPVFTAAEPSPAPQPRQAAPCSTLQPSMGEFLCATFGGLLILSQSRAAWKLFKSPAPNIFVFFRSYLGL